MASVAPQTPGLQVMCVRRQGTGRRAQILLLGSWQVLRGADLQTSLSLSFRFFFFFLIFGQPAQLVGF